MAYVETSETVIDFPEWYRRLGSRVVTDPASQQEIDLSRLECVCERITEMPNGSRLSCDFVTTDRRIPITSFAFPEKRIFIHIQHGYDEVTGYAVRREPPELNDNVSSIPQANTSQGE